MSDNQLALLISVLHRRYDPSSKYPVACCGDIFYLFDYIT